jgi:hypothetical protein
MALISIESCITLITANMQLSRGHTCPQGLTAFALAARCFVAMVAKTDRRLAKTKSFAPDTDIEVRD